MLTRWLDWFVRDRRTGRIVLAQWPNAWLWIVLASWAVERWADGRIRDAASWIGLAAVVVWAGDELLRGVNPWRRCLGAAVLIWIAVSRAV